MCGVCGYVNLDGAPASRDIVAKMNRTLTHRGPDDHGTFVQGFAAFGHRRLSIVDLARGRQPMHSDDGRLTIVYNGEVYNHQEIRTRLERQQFRTNCDTETLLAAYEEMGAACLSELRGMFAFAIFDDRTKALFLARDRLGIKPLYYYKSDRLFAFASEIKALLAHPDISARVNTSRLSQQLTVKYTLDDETLFSGINKVQPGHSLTLKDGIVASHKYWDLSFTPKLQFQSMTEAAEEFRHRFNSAVSARLMADVPLGVFLSGGIDSSVIAASMAEMTNEPIKAFSIAFPQPEYSELTYSAKVARHIGADVRELVLSPTEWLTSWPRMVYHEDEPIAHPSSIPLHFVSKLAAHDVKVVLTGEGSDELLAGYERYYQTLANLRLGKLFPRPVRVLAQALIDMMPDRFLAKKKAVRTAAYLPSDIDSLFLDNYGAFKRADLSSLLRPEFQLPAGDVYASFGQLMEASDADELLDKILYADIKTYLLELLMKQDQMSMSASIESRVPFLDHHLVEFVCALPTKYKLLGFQTKRILRHALGATIPREIVTRSKKGFPTPIREWFRSDFASQLEKLLLSPDARLNAYLRPEAVRAVFERHVRGEWDLQEQLWTLGNLELWLRVVIDGEDAEAIFNADAQEVEACAYSG